LRGEIRDLFLTIVWGIGMRSSYVVKTLENGLIR